MNSNVDKSTFSRAQHLEIRGLIMKYQDAVDLDVCDSAIWFGNQITGYLNALMLEVTIISGHEKKAASLLEWVAEVRRDSREVLHNYLWRKPCASAEDIIRELSRVVTVPDYLAELIRQDIGAWQQPKASASTCRAH